MTGAGAGTGGHGTGVCRRDGVWVSNVVGIPGAAIDDGNDWSRALVGISPSTSTVYIFAEAAVIAFAGGRPIDSGMRDVWPSRRESSPLNSKLTKNELNT
jgi:hypothetical protein